MPLLWRYLLRKYLQVFSFCVTGFISVLLVTRFQDIARFAATGASPSHVLLFVLYQIPFILPLAIPVSCLIAALLLFQQMSRSHELTALRCAGLGILPIAFPLLMCGCVMAAVNFTIVSEISPRCRALSKELAYQMTAINPLCLLQKQTLIKLKNSYIDMKVLKSGHYAEDVIFAIQSAASHRLGLMIAKKLCLQNDTLMGSDVTFISSIDPKKEDYYDHLVIENQAQMQTEAGLFSQYLKSSEKNLSYDSLSCRLLQARKKSEHGVDAKLHARALQEMVRRASLGLAAFSFTLIGIAFGLEISREKKWTHLFWPTALASLYLIAFVSAKSLKYHCGASILCYLLPHVVIFFFCLRHFKQIAQGWEG